MSKLKVFDCIKWQIDNIVDDAKKTWNLNEFACSFIKSNLKFHSIKMEQQLIGEFEFSEQKSLIDQLEKTTEENIKLVTRIRELEEDSSKQNNRIKKLVNLLEENWT